MTKKIMMAMVALGILLFSSPSFAECDSLCRQKCRATAARGGLTVELCIEKWSYIRSKYGAQASQFEGRSGRWTRDLCENQCRIGFKYRASVRYPYESIAACIKGIPCSKYGGS